MRAAGMVEFTLAFALTWTPLVRRVSAIVLLGIFTSACFQFGMLDVIGHSVIIVALVAIFADDRSGGAEYRTPWLAPAWLCAALSLTLLTYYIGHAAIFHTAIL